MINIICSVAMCCTLQFCHAPKGVYGAVRYDITADQMDLVYRCVMSEAGGDGSLSQQGVTTVIFNRLFSPNFPDSIDEIIVPGQFSTADNGDITDEVRRNVNIALMRYGTKSQILPYNCYYFQAWDYHTFGIPYCQLGNNYFSLSEEATD